MFTLLGFEITLPEFLIFLHEPVLSFIVNLAAWILVALLINLVVMRFLLFVTRQLPGDLEDIIHLALRPGGPLSAIIHENVLDQMTDDMRENYHK